MCVCACVIVNYTYYTLLYSHSCLGRSWPQLCKQVHVEPFCAHELNLVKQHLLLAHSQHTCHRGQELQGRKNFDMIKYDGKLES